MPQYCSNLTELIEINTDAVVVGLLSIVNPSKSPANLAKDQPRY